MALTREKDGQTRGISPIPYYRGKGWDGTGEEKTDQDMGIERSKNGGQTRTERGRSRD